MFSMRGRGLSTSNIYRSRSKGRSGGLTSKRYRQIMSSTERRNVDRIYPEYNIAIIENRS